MTDKAQQFAQKFIEAIESGLNDGKWTRPWNRVSSFPVNPANDNYEYQGSNAMLLFMLGGGYWATYKQWKKLGAQVREGEKGTLVCRPITFVKEEDDGTKKRIGTGRFTYYSVFSSSQVDGWEEPEVAEGIDFQPMEAIEADMKALGVPVHHGGGRAFYAPSQDRIQMPQPETFHTVADYYTTLLHEGGHATGHKSRLDRDLMTGRFGDEAYAFEELVAELCSVFCAQHYGIALADEIDTNHVKYVKSWLKVLENDHTAIQKAASLAERASKYITQQQAVKEDIAEAA